MNVELPHTAKVEKLPFHHRDPFDRLLIAQDLGSVSNALAPLLPAGFYYKTFKWPAGAWKRLYEPAIRAAAGLGRAPSLPDPDRYVSRYAHCDVLVVGAGRPALPPR